ncbi:MAG: Rieske (2Fe-2S) protein [Gammaproteobacteria bacterium]|uniref:Rieske (2Fe-2S) protein n=1 Tax=Pseudomaricurvus alcaniphilus TaxID=1166482 RepID=UPI00140810F8|nr:Rieske (2Fe-2S) protein [Gammaproteobacteria bacterium]NHN35850.1 Rieske (2Fe-2S) protein [Pseudomaricurvus alcaniphilus]
MGFQALEKLHQLHDGYKRAFRVGQLELLLIQEEGRVYLLENRCPHMEAPLTYGRVQNGQIRCPMHGICFELATGKCGPATPGSLRAVKTYIPVYEGNTVGVVL